METRNNLSRAHVTEFEGAGTIADAENRAARAVAVADAARTGESTSRQG